MPGADIEHVIAGLERERADQEFAVVELHEPGLLIGPSELGRVLFKADDAASLRQVADHRDRNAVFDGFGVSNERIELYVGARDDVDEMNLHCCGGSEHERMR